MTGFIKRTVIGLFMLGAVMPFIQQQLNLFHIRPLEENRRRKPRPADWRGLLQSGTPFAKKFEEYFNDNYGFRDLLIRIRNEVDFRAFHKSEKIIIGRDGWLFYRSVLEDEEIGTERMRPAEWDTMYSRLLRLNRALASRGITLVVLPCPMKNSIYPEMLPANAPRRPSPNSLQRYREFLKAHPEIVTVDPLPLLMNLKNGMQVYYRTDFHWTEAAGAYVARELVQRLGDLSGKKGLWNQPIHTVLETKPAGGENTSLALLWPATETAPYPADPNPDRERGEYSDMSNAYEWTYTSKLPDKSQLIPDTVMFGDSYSDAFVRAGFTAYFARIQRFYNWDFSKGYRSIPPGTRFVIFQHLESMIMMNHTPFWPDELRND